MDNENDSLHQADDTISPDELLFTLSQFIRLYQKGMYHAKLPFVPHRGQDRVLRIIADHDGLNQKELAERLDIRSASVSELLNKLEHSNLIIREKNEVDKRFLHVFLSDNGRAHINSSKAHDDFAEMLFGALSCEERRALDATLKKLSTSFEVQQLLEGDDPDEPLPPHLREGHMPPPPHEGEPLPPHLRGGHMPPSHEGEPLPPHLQK